MLKTTLLKKLFLGVASFVLGCSIFLLPVGVSAQEQPAASSTTVEQETETTSTTPAPLSGNIADNVCKGVLSTKDGVIEPGTDVQACHNEPDEGFGFLARRIINVFSIVVGAVSVIMIIIGGFRYIISGGDSSNIQAAKNTILYALVGLLIVLFAQIIVRFILTNAVQGN